MMTFVTFSDFVTSCSLDMNGLTCELSALDDGGCVSSVTVGSLMMSLLVC